MFTRERHRRGVVYFGPYANAKKVRETLDVLNRVFQYRPCEGPKPGRHSGIPCLDYHIERCKAPCVGYISREDVRRDDRARDRVPLRRDAADPARARAPDAGGGRRASASRTRRVTGTGCSRSATSRSGRRPTGARSAPSTCSGSRPRATAPQCRSSRSATAGWSTATASTSRTSRAQELGGRARGVLPRVLRVGAEHPAAARRPAAMRATRPRSRSSSPTGAGRGSRCGRPSAARSGGCRSSPTRTRSSRSSPTWSSPSRSACAAWRRSRSCARRSTWRACRSGSSATTSRTSRPSRRSARWSSSRTRCRRRRTTGSSACAGSTGPDDFAAMAEVVSRRFARLADVTARSTTSRSRRSPNLVVIDGGKGQLSAALAAMQAFDLPRVAVIALAKKEEEVFVPGRAGADRARAATRRGCSSCSGSATRRTGSRSASTGSGARRGRAARSSTTSQGIGPVRRRALLRHFGSAERAARGDPGGARRGAGRTGEDGARDLRAAPQGRPRLSIGPCGDSSRSCSCSRSPAAAAAGDKVAADDHSPRPPTPADPGKAAMEAAVTAAAAGEDRRDLGDALLAVEEAPRADARRVRGARRRHSS